MSDLANTIGKLLRAIEIADVIEQHLHRLSIETLIATEQRSVFDTQQTNKKCRYQPSCSKRTPPRTTARPLRSRQSQQRRTCGNCANSRQPTTLIKRRDSSSYLSRRLMYSMTRVLSALIDVRISKFCKLRFCCSQNTNQVNEIRRSKREREP
jgi:hypothetical protein